MSNRVLRRAPRPSAAPAVSALIGAVLGVLTAFGQKVLPEHAASLANSAGAWSAVAFALAFLAPTALAAILSGALALLALLAGYVFGAALLDATAGRSLIVFWGAAALVAGPALGQGAHWIRRGPARTAALGGGGLAGVLIGEGVYGLTTIADTTSPVYWGIQIAAGALVLALVFRHRLRALRPTLIALATAAVVAATVIALYRADLITALV